MANVFKLQNLAGTELFSVDDSGNVSAAGTISTTGTDDFGTSGIKADVIAESTATAGVTLDGLKLKDGFVVATDSQGVKLGTGVDDTLTHDGTNTLWTHTTGALRLDNQAVTGATQMDLGTNTSATKFVVRSDAGTELFSVEGGGVIRAGGSMWAGAPSPANPDPSVAHVFFDDFTDAIFDATHWVVTEDDAADTQAVSDVQFGAVTLTCKATTDDDACQITWANETFKLTSGKKLWFEARIKSSSGDMTNSDWFVGLMEAEDITGVADNMPANGIGFHKEDGAATFSASSSDNGVNLQSAAVGTIVDATWIKIGLLFDGGATGAATITPYINGAAGTPIASVTYATMAEMAVLFMVRNGNNVTTQTLDVDYVKVVCER